MLKKTIVLLFTLASAAAVMTATSAQADGYRMTPQSTPKLSVMTLPKAPQCAPGFLVKNKQLKTAGGKSWYEYQCEQEQTVYRFCNPGQTVFVPKNTFSNLASPPSQVNSVLRMSYACGMLEG